MLISLTDLLSSWLNNILENNLIHLYYIHNTFLKDIGMRDV